MIYRAAMFGLWIVYFRRIHIRLRFLEEMVSAKIRIRFIFISDASL